ncbi:nucleotidyltransferase domain-containing protein [Candidatus Woesearchaeota archaeon]|nr:nucleotidyltransferase domain-containing protein [Candidatus Woesearchaeota archaeon]
MKIGYSNPSIGDKINKIILFGSVARGDFTEKSDVDIFADADEKLESDVLKILKLFDASRARETWKLKNVMNEISVKVGNLQKWRLRREVISSGIMLYGKYSEIPEKTKYSALITLDVRKKSTAEQMQIWRNLYGYAQKIANKTYSAAGLVQEAGGKKLGKAIILIPMERRIQILQFLNKNRVHYSLHEIWSDQF